MGEAEELGIDDFERVGSLPLRLASVVLGVDLGRVDYFHKRRAELAVLLNQLQRGRQTDGGDFGH